MIIEFIKAAFIAGIPVALTSYLLAWWALKNNYFGTIDGVGVKGLEQEVKRLTKARKKKKGKDEPAEPNPPKMNPVHNKWLSFGGGFYGVVALLTYALVELNEVRDFISNLGGLTQWLSNISIDTIINFLIDSLKNFVIAISWPWYWMTEISSRQPWIWFLVAYGAYWAGTRFALQRFISSRN